MSWKRVVPYYIPLVPRRGVKYNMSNPVDRYLYATPKVPDDNDVQHAKRRHFARCGSYHDKRVIPHDELPNVFLGTIVRFGFWLAAEHIIPQFPCIMVPTGLGTYTITVSLCAAGAYVLNAPTWRSEFLNDSRLDTLECIHK